LKAVCEKARKALPGAQTQRRDNAFVSASDKLAAKGLAGQMLSTQFASL
jgi:hypothetical protein